MRRERVFDYLKIAIVVLCHVQLNRFIWESVGGGLS